MGRHGKDQGGLYTYAERKENAHGSLHMRLASGSSQNFDCCCLSLVQPKNPVVDVRTGNLYEKSCALEHILACKAFLRANRSDSQRKLDERAAENSRRNAEWSCEQERNFARREDSVSSVPLTGVLVEDEPLQNPQKAPEEAHFWLPCGADVVQTTQRGTQKTDVEKGTPDGVDGVTPKDDRQSEHDTEKRVAPLNTSKRKMLRLKDLRPVVFHKAPGNRDDVGGKEHYICPICVSTLKNASRPVVLGSGHVLCSGCMRKTVEANGRDPLTDAPARVKDIVFLQSGGGSFAGSGAKVATLYKPSAR